MKLLLLLGLIFCFSNPFKRHEEYERRHAMDILRHQLPVPGETLASIVLVPNLHLEEDKSFKIWLPMKLFWRNYMKKYVGEETGRITGIPKGRKVTFTAHKGPDPLKYMFISESIDLKEYAKMKDDTNYVKIEDSEKELSIVLWGYVYGQNIVMTEEISFQTKENTLPTILPTMLKSVKDGDAIDLKISKEYLFHISDRRVRSSPGLTEAPELDAVDMEMVLPDHVIDSESSPAFKPDVIGEEGASAIEPPADDDDAKLIKFMSQ